MASDNQGILQRFNQDTGLWDNLQYRNTQSAGVLSDHFFDTSVPTSWGAATYRIIVTDNNSGYVGVTSIVAVTLSR